jgi:hypothetical protein
MVNDASNSNLREAIGCLGLALFFVVCLQAPSIAYHVLGPWAAIVGSGIALGAWAHFGPQPMPGLLPGLLGIAVFFNSIGWAGFALYGIVRAWLNR